MTRRPASSESLSATDLAQRYRRIRDFTVELAMPLSVEDQVIQTMPDVSPTKWHLAHTTWFFERFILCRLAPGYEPFHPRYHELFNSYYQTIGNPFARPRRGLLSRPTVAEVRAYREAVDRRMGELIHAVPDGDRDELARLQELGLQHEQQHQELLLTDIKHVFSCNPLYPAYAEPPAPADGDAPPLEWLSSGGGAREIGSDGTGFGFDNETPRHAVMLRDFELASRPVTCGEYLAFVEDRGYGRPELWLADGWERIRSEGWDAPLYWTRVAGDWQVFTLGGLRQLDPHEPVCHVSFYEADAFARWSGVRLPTEAEWEVACADLPVRGNFADSYRLHPRRAEPESGSVCQAFGDVWEWTASAYGPYPGYRPPEGALGEYNGKFMCNQIVLRGGSCASSRDHLRPTYRNFFYPHQRWQFSGIRLAR